MVGAREPAVASSWWRAVAWRSLRPSGRIGNRRERVMLPDPIVYQTAAIVIAGALSAIAIEARWTHKAVLRHARRLNGSDHRTGIAVLHERSSGDGERGVPRPSRTRCGLARGDRGVLRAQVDGEGGPAWCHPAGG
ncbi:hypothetical protein C9J85_03090 [Haloferax sp. wsp5]|nr:hypothetical protein C9J85_03090 [Haloferax sp. wsp5]